MSGDAQPRKRKNKGKKKDLVVQRPDDFKERSGFRKSSLSDDVSEEDIFAPLKNATDEVIHVQKDVGLGGNVVTKLVFFCLLATIGVMVGIILLEYRGSTDEETSSALDSPWSVTLEQWLDKEPDHHAHEEEILEEENEEHEHDNEHEEDHGLDDHTEESHGGGTSAILSWFTFGGGEEVENNSDEHEAVESGDGFSFGSLLSYLPFSGSSKDSVLDEEDTGGGSWFGFGGKEESVEEVEQEGEGDEVEKEDDIVEQDEEEPEEEEEEEEDQEEEEEVEEEMEEDDEEQQEEEAEDSTELYRSKKYVRDISEEEEEEEEEEEDDKLNLSEPEEDEEEEEEEEDQNNLSEEEEEIEEGDKNLSEEEEEEEIEEGDKNLSEEEEEIEGGDRNLSEEEEEVEEAYKNLSEEEDDEQNEDLSIGEENEEEEEEDNDSPLEHRDQDENDVDEEQTSVEETGKDKSEEELFPEALEALRREAEELAAKEKAKKEEEKVEETEASENDFQAAEVDEEGQETEGTGEEAADPLTEAPVTTELKEEVHVEPVVPIQVAKIESAPPPARTELPPIPSPVITPQPPAQVEEPAEESPVEDEEEDIEEEAAAAADGEDEEEEESEGLEIDKDKFRELIAKYGQDTPESSEIEQSDDDIQKVDYSGGEEESPGEEEEEEEEDSPAEVVTEDEQVPSEDELKEWTGIKKTDINKITKLDSDSDGEGAEEEEEEEDEEESEDETPPPPPQPTTKPKGGPRDLEEDYQNAYITNEEDWQIKEELDRADEEFNYEKARTLFRALLAKYPNSPRARYGFARTYDEQAEKEKSNQILNIAISGYQDALLAPNIPDILFINVASRLINRLRFRGLHLKAVDVHNQLIQRFNSTPEYRTDLAITYLMINRLEDARLVLKEVLAHWPEDPTALAHYGLVLKLQGNIHGCVKYLEKGLATDFTTTKDARLFFHLGDALSRVGREADAIKVYDKAVAYGLFRSRYQRSLYNVDRLTARPWWTPEETTYASFFKLLEDNWLQIRDEGVKALKINGLYRDEAEGLRDKGDWKQFELFARGLKIKKNCETTPFTCSLIGSFEPAATCKRGQSKFSIMEAGTHVWPHCGPTNCRLRAHLGLIVPEGPQIRVANITKHWKEGKVFIFDDSFEHEVWHNGTSLRLVLIVDVWHPELTRKEKLSLSAI